jgi:hypothetical protein
MSLNGGIYYRLINILYGCLLVGLAVFFVITSYRTIHFLKSSRITAAAHHTKKVSKT